jgi:5'-nucleotidase/UDP-sugar diphosphatase
MSKVSRRHALGLGLSAGFSVAMLSGSSEEALAAPANPTFTLLLVNDIYKKNGAKGRGGFAGLAAIV